MSLVDRIPTKVLEKACAVLAARKAKGKKREPTPPNWSPSKQGLKAHREAFYKDPSNVLKPGTKIDGEEDPRVKLNTWVVYDKENLGHWGGFKTKPEAHEWALKKFGKSRGPHLSGIRYTQSTTKRRRQLAEPLAPLSPSQQHLQGLTPEQKRAWWAENL